MIAGRHRAHSMETASREAPEIAAQLDAARAVLCEYGANPAALDRGIEAAHTIASLTHDTDLAIGTLLHQARAAGLPRDIRQLETRLGANPSRLAAELERLGELQLPVGWSAAQGLTTQQAETLRKMLLAVAADPRLVVARLAEQLVQLRHARDLVVEEQRRLALETRTISAPLANRLGVWNLKWELEDLA